MLSIPILPQIVKNLTPIKPINMQKIQLMIQNEYRRIARLYLLFKSRLLLQYLLKLRIVFLHITDRLRQTELHIIVILIFKNPTIRNIRVFQYLLMNVLFLYQKFQINIQHYRSIRHKDVLHVIILVWSILVPYEISNEAFHNKSVLTQLLQKIALSPEHRIVLSLF